MTRDELNKLPQIMHIGGKTFELVFLDRQTGDTCKLDKIPDYLFDEGGRLRWLDVIYMME